MVLTGFAAMSYGQETTKSVTVYEENKTDYREQVMWGLKAGANYSNVFDTKGESFQHDARFGFAGGAFVAIPIGKYLGLQPSVIYSKRGFHGTGRVLGGTYDFNRITTFLDVPVLVSIKPSEFLAVVVGPQYSYLLKQKDVFKTASSSIEQEKEFQNANIRKNLLCFVAGFDINMKHAVLGARIGWDLHNNNGDATTTTPRYRNTWIQTTLGFRL